MRQGFAAAAPMIDALLTRFANVISNQFLAKLAIRVANRHSNLQQKWLWRLVSPSQGTDQHRDEKPKDERYSNGKHEPEE